MFSIEFVKLLWASVLIKLRYFDFPWSFCYTKWNTVWQYLNDKFSADASKFNAQPNIHHCRNIFILIDKVKTNVESNACASLNMWWCFEFEHRKSIGRRYFDHKHNYASSIQTGLGEKVSLLPKSIRQAMPHQFIVVQCTKNGMKIEFRPCKQ